jgi:hypothetical protein
MSLPTGRQAIKSQRYFESYELLIFGLGLFLTFGFGFWGFKIKIIDLRYILLISNFSASIFSVASMTDGL